MSESTISLDYTNSGQPRSTKSIISDISGIIAFIKNPLKVKSKAGSIYYVSADGKVNSDGKSPDKSMVDIQTLMHNKNNWSSGDVIRFRRGEIFEGHGSLAKLQDAGVFLDAYGPGQDPIIKSNGKFIEIHSTSWM